MKKMPHRDGEKIVTPFDASQALLIGFFFGCAITALLASEYYARKMDEKD
tara:strand:- start:261 stop:410 length:150 start_codon:yes stop_codon:yes gene_type:complete